MAQILVIDDDEQIRGVLRRMLERAGHSVVEAADGELGTQAHRAHPADLIITDIFMPQRDGLETIVALRREFVGVKLIAISGGDRTGALDLRQEALLFGAARTLQKPFTATELLAVVGEVLAQPPAPAQGPTTGGTPPKVE